jgi:hypothetical protein
VRVVCLCEWCMYTVRVCLVCVFVSSVCVCVWCLFSMCDVFL